MARRSFFNVLRDIIHEIFPVVPARGQRRATTREVKDFRSGRQTSARAAEEYATSARRREELRKARRKARREAEPKKPRKPPKRRGREYDRFERIWMEEELTRPDRKYRQHFEFIQGLPYWDQLEPEDQDDIWRSYVQNMTAQARGKHRYNDIRSNPFWRETGIHPKNFDWDDWRQAMGYKRRR